jgi:hypothetical protein
VRLAQHRFSPANRVHVQQWQKSCNAVALAHSQAEGISFRPRNEIYNALCVFKPVITRKLVGNATKSAACYIDGFEQPTVDNWQEFFLGNQEEVADAVVEMMNPQPRKQLMSAQLFALSPLLEAEVIVPTPQLAPGSYPNKNTTGGTSEAIDVKSIVYGGEDRIPF